MMQDRKPLVGQPLDLPEPFSVELCEAPVGPKTNFLKARGLCANPACRTPLRATGRRSVAKFCSSKCRDDVHNRRKAQGHALIDIAKRWRRYKQSGDFTLMTRLLDSMIADDKAAGVDRYQDPPLQAYHTGRNISPYKK